MNGVAGWTHPFILSRKQQAFPKAQDVIAYNNVWYCLVFVEIEKWIQEGIKIKIALC